MRLQDLILLVCSGYRKPPITPLAPEPAIAIWKLPDAPRRVRIFKAFADADVPPQQPRDLFSAIATPQPPAPSPAAPAETTVQDQPAVTRARKSTTGWKRLDDSKRLAILTRYARGLPTAQIAIECGVSDSTVSDVAISAGLRRQTRKNSKLRRIA
jgi:DNA-directed RNA polymerase specialized sigma24 family protein